MLLVTENLNMEDRAFKEEINQNRNFIVVKNLKKYQQLVSRQLQETSLGMNSKILKGDVFE